MIDSKKLNNCDNVDVCGANDVCEKYNNSSEAVIARLSKSKWTTGMNFIENLPKTSAFLDAGCGSGRNLFEAKKLGIDNLTGFDFSEKMLNTTRAKFDVDVPRLILGDVINIDSYFESASFDAIICIAVISHIRDYENRVRSISNLCKLLAPGGKLLISFWSVDAIKETNAGDYIIRINDIDWYYYMHTEETATSLIINSIAGTNITWELTICKKNYYFKLTKPCM